MGRHRNATTEHIPRDARQTVVRAAVPAPGQYADNHPVTDFPLALCADVCRAAGIRRRLWGSRSRRERVVFRDGDGDADGGATVHRLAADGLQRGRPRDSGDVRRDALREGQIVGIGAGLFVVVSVGISVGGGIIARGGGGGRVLGSRPRGDRLPLPRRTLEPAVRCATRSEPLVLHAQRRVRRHDGDRGGRLAA